MAPYSQNQNDCLAEAFGLERRGKYSKGLKTLESLFPPAFFDARKEERLYAEASLRKGALKGYLGDEEASRDLLTDAHWIFERLGEKRLAAESLTYLAASFTRTGHFEEARAWLDCAFSEQSAENDPVRLQAVIFYLLVYLGENREDDLIKFAEDWKGAFDGCNDHWLQGNYYCNLGLAYKRKNDETNTMRCFYNARNNFTECKHFIYLAALENNIARLDWQRNSLASAEFAIDKAIMIHRAYDNVRWLASSLDTRALILLDAGRLDEALKTINESIKILKNSPNDPFLKDSLETKRKILGKIGKSF